METKERDRGRVSRPKIAEKAKGHDVDVVLFVFRLNFLSNNFDVKVNTPVVVPVNPDTVSVSIVIGRVRLLVFDGKILVDTEITHFRSASPFLLTARCAKHSVSVYESVSMKKSRPGGEG